MKIVIQVHLLPTEDETRVILSKIPSQPHKLFYTYNDKIEGSLRGNSSYQHLYHTSDEEIKEGDWFYSTFNDHQPKIQQRKGDWKTCFNQHKIIATTDKSLKYSKTGYTEDRGRTFYQSLPQIPQQFQKDFCKAGGIWEVELEYKDWCDYDDDSPTGLCDIPDIRLVITPNNEVIIHLIEPKVYTKEEVEDIIHHFYNDFCNGTGNEPEKDNWIKENL